MARGTTTPTVMATGSRSSPPNFVVPCGDRLVAGLSVVDGVTPRSLRLTGGASRGAVVSVT